MLQNSFAHRSGDDNNVQNEAFPDFEQYLSEKAVITEKTRASGADVSLSALAEKTKNIDFGMEAQETLIAGTEASLEGFATDEVLPTKAAREGVFSLAINSGSSMDLAAARLHAYTGAKVIEESTGAQYKLAGQCRGGNFSLFSRLAKAA